MSELNVNKRGLLDLIIASLPGITVKERVLLLQKFDFEEDFIALSKTEIEKILGRTIKCSWDTDEIRAGADRMEKVCGLRSINWVSYTDRAFPPLLREMYDPPPVIFYRGVLPSAEKPLLAMVGTRKPSPEAAMQAYTIGREAGRAGISVVSGLALGIDVFQVLLSALTQCLIRETFQAARAGMLYSVQALMKFIRRQTGRWRNRYWIQAAR